MRAGQGGAVPARLPADGSAPETPNRARRATPACAGQVLPGVGATLGCPAASFLTRPGASGSLPRKRKRISRCVSAGPPGPDQSLGQASGRGRGFCFPWVGAGDAAAGVRAVGVARGVPEVGRWASGVVGVAREFSEGRRWAFRVVDVAREFPEVRR